MPDEAKYSILIVDDEKANLDILNHILKKDYTVIIAKSGRAALQRAAQFRPALILLDIIMPDMTGFEVLEVLKSSVETRDIPVIFITGLANVDDEEKGFKMGAVDYITKPFNNAIVKARVNTHIKILKQMQMIEKLGLIDALTDIPNRRSFDNQLNLEWNRAIREGTNLSLLMMDIDRFKDYNDTYGHPMGDALLKTVAKVTEKALKRTTDIVARTGGEEFAILLPNTDLNGAVTIAERIRQNIEKCVIIDTATNLPTKVTASLGVTSIIPTLTSSVEEFIEEADRTLYYAKGSGRNKVCY